MQRLLKLACLIVALGISATAVPAQACPMCKIAHEDSTDPAVAARPRAYMYSILFMLSMPATLLSIFGVSFYRLAKKQEQLNAELMAAMDSQSNDPTAKPEEESR
ncbi:hypothetical protein [Planctomicrobium piriforme]|uniref:Uncharacterized protein n=1 Tax=Planctomicrobium piriforme TaxID=1576369 RepID=A0A1I3CZV1_9PLAN|nr:hypothetical protein [Planctomicrobium piriforme]SFH79751.1 hypothetical protein SAMN05421753_10324 [Planctomicrobium piriforme]